MCRVEKLRETGPVRLAATAKTTGEAVRGGEERASERACDDTALTVRGGKGVQSKKREPHLFLRD